MASTDSRKMAEEISRLSKAVEDMQRSPQLAHSSIENGSLPVRDEDGQVRTIIGKQDDGTFTTVDRNGGQPPAPAQPVVYDHQPGLLTINSYGLTDDGAPWPLDARQIEVHVSATSPVVPTPATKVGTFPVDGGGQVSVALDAGDYFVALVALNTSGVQSEISPEVPATVRQPLTVAGNLTYVSPSEPVGLTAEDEGAIWYDENRGNLLHRWDGSQWVTLTVGTKAVDIAAITPERMSLNAGASLYNVVPDPRFLDPEMNAWRLEQVGADWQFGTVVNFLSGDPLDYTLGPKTEEIIFDAFSPTGKPTSQGIYVYTLGTSVWAVDEEMFHTDVFFDPSIDLSVWVDGFKARIEYLDGANTVLGWVTVDGSVTPTEDHLLASGVPANTVKFRFKALAGFADSGFFGDMVVWRNPGQIAEPGQGFFFSEETSPASFPLVRDVSFPPDTPMKGAMHVFHRGIDAGVTLGRVLLEARNPDGDNYVLDTDAYDWDQGTTIDVDGAELPLGYNRVVLSLDPYSVNSRVEVYGGFLRAEPVDPTLHGFTYADTLVVQENFIAPGDTNWIEPTLLNGYQNYGAEFERVAYRKKNGVAYIKGFMNAAGNRAADTPIFVLPVGFRPDADKHVPVVTDTDGTARVKIKADGTVTANHLPASAWISLANIAFPVDV